jgi:hypothetical protein
MNIQPAKKTARRPKKAQITTVPEASWKEDLIRQTAYYFYESRGREPGHELEDWLLAESLVAQQPPKLVIL